VAAAVTAEEVRRHLTDVDFPADKDALVAAAEQRGAAQEAVRALRAIPPVDYANRDQVISSVELDPAPDVEPGAAARTPAPPGVGQASRAPQEDRVKGEDRRNV
jgi:hypothetical protein